MSVETANSTEVTEVTTSAPLLTVGQVMLLAGLVLIIGGALASAEIMVGLGILVGVVAAFVLSCRELGSPGN